MSAHDPYKELFEQSADAILIIEGDMFIDCNEAAVRMLRSTSREAVLRTHPSELSPPFQPDGRPSFEKANEMIAIAFDRGSHRFEWAHRRADGEIFPVEVLLTSVQEAKRKVLHVVWRDITERKELEERLRHSQKMEAVGKLAGGIAHDFNNVLVVIQGHSELLAEGLEAIDPLMEHVEAIGTANRRAADLVRQLLAFGRRQALTPRVIDLNALALDLRKLLPRLIGEDLELVVDLTPDDVRVLADRTELERVLMNIASNARDAMPRGGKLTLSTRRITLSESTASLIRLPPGSYARISATDTGTGMDEATCSRAFEPFFTTKGAGEGTGLGLATVHGIVRQSGGEVHIESLPGQGTTVHVSLPSTTEPVSDPTRSEVVRAADGNETLLVVEDESQVSGLIVRLLGKRGYKVLLAHDGAEGLEQYRKHADSIDLVVSDVIMPRVAGPEMIHKLREEGHTPTTLFISGYTDDALSRFTDLGTDVDLLVKPFTPDELVARIRAALDRRREIR